MATEEAAAVGAGEARALPEEVADVKEAVGAEEGKAEAAEAKKAEAEVEGEREKAKKPRSRKPRSAGPQHPPYFEMIKEAILALDGKTGSSPYAIAKYIGEQHKEVLPANYRKVLAVQLRNFAAKGRLVKVKASFKLAEAEEKAAAAMAKAKRRRSTKKPSAPKEAKKAVAPARPARAKRAKKAAPAPVQPKQPRSIRTAVAAKKASA